MAAHFRLCLCNIRFHLAFFASERAFFCALLMARRSGNEALLETGLWQPDSTILLRGGKAVNLAEVACSSLIPNSICTSSQSPATDSSTSPAAKACSMHG